MRRYNLIALVVFAIALGGILALSPRNTQKVQSAFLGMITPFLTTGSTLQTRFVALREGLKTLDELQADNNRISVELKQLRATNQMLSDLDTENKRLRRALQYRERSTFKLIPARIIARDATAWWNTARIDKGFDDGIAPDMAVLTEDGLVGKTTTVAKHVSIILLISDENCKVAATVEDTHEQGIVRGERTSSSSMPEVSLNFLSKTANLKPGQKVFSSGVGGVFPQGVALGTVKEFQARALDGHATLIPAVDLTTLEDVFVVRK